jgi:hypothetical protein
MAGRFFADADAVPVAPPTYDQPRPLIGAGQRLNLTRSKERLDKRAVAEWQVAAWRFFETIGEIHYAFNLVGQVCSRVRLYPAIVASPNEVPVHVDTWLESLGDKGNTDRSRGVVDKAKALVEDLVENTPGRTSGLMRTFAMNFGVPGEVYLAQDKENEQWLPLSSEELASQGNRWRVRRSRGGQSTRGAGGADIWLPGDAWVARLWRSHPRWGDEPDSSMLGVLDQCEQLTLLDQAMRNMARRAMNAGLVFLPEGITAYASADDETIADAIAASALQAVESEAALSTVTPRVVTGPAELGEKIKRIPLTDAVDPNVSAAAQRLLERILQGVDIPKDVVKGLADVKYANAIVIDDNLYRAHIEPLILLIVDTLTSVYLRPLLMKDVSPQEKGIADRIVLWADTSSIVTRPDKSQAANEGYDKHLLSGEAWRRARGFSETDAPQPDELVRRLAMEKAPIPPEMASVMLASLDPEFFDQQAEQNAGEAGIPEDVQSFLDQGESPPPREPSASERAGSTMEQAAGPLNGGQITPGGNLPPAARV